MEPLLNWQTWIDLALPMLGSRLEMVYLSAGGLLGFSIAIAAHMAWREAGRDPWRSFRFIGLTWAAAFWLRAVCRGAVIGSNEALVAAFSVLDLALLAMSAAACRVLLPRREGKPLRLALHAMVAAAIFLGLLGGSTPQPLLARNLPAAAAHLLVLLNVFVMLQWALVQRQRRHRQESTSSKRALMDETSAHFAEIEKLARERDDALGQRAEDKERAHEAMRRTRLLEHLLAGAVDLQARRDEHDLHAYAVELAHAYCGFEEVVLYQWSDSLGVFEVRAVEGCDSDKTAMRLGAHMQREAFDEIVHPRFRISDSYLVPPAFEVVRQSVRIQAQRPSAPADEADWPDAQRLVVPLTDPAGTVHGFLQLNRPESGRAPDLLSIRYIELLARQLAGVLEGLAIRERLAAHRAELAGANERLQALGDLRSNFVANVGHELRTPLTSIISYAEMLRDRGDDMSREMRREFVSVIHDQGQRFNEIVDDLLDLDRIEGGGGVIERAECDLAAIVRRLADSWRRRAADAEQELSIVGDRNRVVLEADPVLCQQLVSHLVDNALKFTPSGGSIGIRLSEQGTAVRLDVEDSGIGIPEQKLHTIFEQFFQVDGSSTRVNGGQGIGLALCQDIASRHDGRIWAENVPGGGTRLSVLLPRRPHVIMPEPPEAMHPALHEPRLFLQRLVHWVGENLGVRTVVLLVADAGGQYLRVLGASGVPAGPVEGLRLASGVGLAGRVWHAGRTRLEAPEPGDVLLAGEAPVLCVPLADEHELRGVVVVRERLDGRPLSDDDRLLLEAMAPRIVFMLARYERYDAQQRDFADIQSTLRVTTRLGTLPHADVAAVCQEICLATARRLELPESEIRHLAFALQYYDVGLGSVPPYLLNKVESLSDDERALLERHVQVGLAALEPLQPPPKVRQIILHHHENYDGTGYPKGLSGEAIPLGSRLVALHDTLRALLQQRPWRSAVPWTEALAEIQALAGTRYCPRLTAIFLKEAARRRSLIEDLRQRADDGEDLKRPAPLQPAQFLRV